MGSIAKQDTYLRCETLGEFYVHPQPVPSRETARLAAADRSSQKR